jgi:hypothetical protein
LHNGQTASQSFTIACRNAHVSPHFRCRMCRAPIIDSKYPKLLRDNQRVLGKAGGDSQVSIDQNNSETCVRDDLSDGKRSWKGI